MPKHPNNHPWPQNLLYDFGLSEATSASSVEAFIAGLPTSDRNKKFLLLRYREGKTYTEIAAAHGMTPAGVRLAIIAMQEKFGFAVTPPPAAPAVALPHMPTAPAIALPTVPAAPPLPAKDDRMARDDSRPLSINLAAVRRFLGLTVEEFARPLPIEDGDSLITRLETGFSRPAPAVLDLICDAWGINRKYLLASQGEMFELQPNCDGLVTLLKKYLAVATFDGKGQQYWKAALVDDLGRLIDVRKLNGREMCRVVRTLYDYLDVEQFEVMLERMGR